MQTVFGNILNVFMRSMLPLGLMVVFYLTHLQGKSQDSINRLYGTYATEIGVTGFVMPDSTIYALGTSSAFMGMSSQVYLMKTNKHGDLMWSQFYGGTGVDQAVDMVYDGDTSIYMVSNSLVNYHKGYDVKIVKTNLNGTVLWERNYGTTAWDIPTKIVKLNSGEMVVCGHTYGGSLGLIDAFLFSFNSSGDSLAFEIFGSAKDDFIYDLSAKGNDTLVMCGTQKGSKDEGWVVEMGPELGFFNEYFFTGLFNYEVNAVEILPNGNYFFGITTDSISGTDHNVLGLVYDDLTHVKLLETWSYATGEEICKDVRFIDNTYAILISTNSFGLGGTEAMVHRFDPWGWYYSGYTFGTVEDDEINALLHNQNGSFTLIGTSQDLYGVSDVWVVNMNAIFDTYDILDSELDINSVQEQSSLTTLECYPNPTNGIVKFKSSGIIQEVYVVDGQGRKSVLAFTQGQIDLSSFSAGIYSVIVKGKDNYLGYFRVVKQ